MFGSIDLDKKIIIFWSPKAASTTIRSMLHYYQTGKCCNHCYTCIHRVKQRDELLTTEKYNDFKLYLIIRNPYDRFLSALNKLINAGEVTFDIFMDTQFVDYASWNIHISPQVSNNGWDYRQFINKDFDVIYDINDLDKFNDDLSLLYPNRSKYNLNILNRGSYIDLSNYTTYCLIDGSYTIKNSDGEIVFLNDDSYKQSLQTSLTPYLTVINDVYKVDFDFFKLLGFDYTDFGTLIKT